MVLLSRARLVATNQTTGKAIFASQIYLAVRRVSTAHSFHRSLRGSRTCPRTAAFPARTLGRAGDSRARTRCAAGFSCTSCDVPPGFRAIRLASSVCSASTVCGGGWSGTRSSRRASFSLRSGPRAFLYHDRWRIATRAVVRDVVQRSRLRRRVRLVRISTLPTELRVPLRRTLSSRALGASPSGGGDPRRGIPRSARRSHASAAAPASSQGSLGRGAQQSVKSTLAPEAAISADALAGTAAVETLEKTSTEENAGQLVAPASDDVADQQVARRSFPSGVEIFPAEEAADFEVAAELRATAFCEDLEARQALPFPPRFIATFRREFAQRERRALKERTAQPSGPSRRCLCLMSRLRSSGAFVVPASPCAQGHARRR